MLQSWEFVPHYAEVEDSPSTNGGMTRADVCADPQYHKASITFYPLFFNDSTGFERETVVVHELVHCMVEPIQQQIKELQSGYLITGRNRRETMERCVTHIANAFYQLDQDRQKVMRKR